MTPSYGTPRPARSPDTDPAAAPAAGSAPADGSGPAAPGAGSVQAALDDGSVQAALDEAIRAVDAPDVVIAYARHGRRTIRCGGTAPAPPVPRELLRYETGSASKPYTGLLLARLLADGALGAGDPAATYLAPGRRPGPYPITLTHLITHTAGLPPLPADLYPGALRQWHTNPYAHYPADRVVAAFLRARPRHRPGTRWRYSNFGVAALGHALAAATGTPWEDLLTGHVLAPLGLSGTALAPAPTDAGCDAASATREVTGDGGDVAVTPGGTPARAARAAAGTDAAAAGTRRDRSTEGAGRRAVDATGHRADGETATPPLLIGGFQAAGAVRGTPGDLLRFVEAHLRPAGSPLEDALLSVRRPVLRRGRGHRDVHTLTWFRHETDRGPVYFHAGATSGQQAFLGFAPGTGTALAAVSTRRFRLRDTFVATAYALLCSPPEET